MKRTVLFILTISTVVACSKKESSPVPDYSKAVPTETAPPVETPAHDSSAIFAEGKSLLEGADCLGCHKVDAKLIGPSYNDVAAKYPNTPGNIDLLAGRIIDGSSGVWGQVPMSAHPGMSRENAKKMVQYILSLKK